MEYVDLPIKRHGFSMINGRLIECDIRQIKYHRDDDMGAQCDAAFTYVVSHADWTEEVPTSNFFMSVNDFKSNEPVKRADKYWLSDLFDTLEFKNDLVNTYVIDNGIVKQITINFKDITFYFDESNRLVSAESPDVPKGGWKSKQIATDHLDIQVVNADGTTSNISGAATLIKLTDEQKAIVDDICGLFKKANDMGVCFVDDWNGCYAFNKKNLDKYCFGYENDLGLNEYLNVQTKEFIVGGFKILHVSEDDSMFFNRK